MSTQTTVALFKGVGKYGGQINHVAVEVLPGTLGFGTALLQKLGYEEIESRRKKGSWGIALFFDREGSSDVIQLISSSNYLPIPSNNNHIAITVDNACEVSEDVRKWAKACGFTCAVEELNSDTYWVEIPQIFTVALEFISK